MYTHQKLLNTISILVVTCSDRDWSQVSHCPNWFGIAVEIDFNIFVMTCSDWDCSNQFVATVQIDLAFSGDLTGQMVEQRTVELIATATARQTADMIHVNMWSGNWFGIAVEIDFNIFVMTCSDWDCSNQFVATVQIDLAFSGDWTGQMVEQRTVELRPCLVPKFLSKLPTFPSHQNFPTHTNF